MSVAISSPKSWIIYLVISSTNLLPSIMGTGIYTKKNGSHFIAASVFFVVCSLDNYMPMHEVAPSAVSIADAIDAMS